MSFQDPSPWDIVGLVVLWVLVVCRVLGCMGGCGYLVLKAIAKLIVHMGS